MKNITQTQIDLITNYLLGSPCPSADVQAIVKILRDLPICKEDNQAS